MTDTPSPPFPDETPTLGLPYLLANQAQKHVTLNTSLRRLDALVQLTAESRMLAEAPESAEGGEAWIVGGGASGAWDGREGEVAAWQDGGWQFFAPQPGWLAYVLDEPALLVWTGTAWEAAVSLPGTLQNLVLLGLGTEADADNPFAAKLNKALWTARAETEGGDGDLRYTLNKEGPAGTLSLLMQSGWSGRAEIGLTGSDDFGVKVSADGEAWKQALVVDGDSGAASFPHGVAHPVSGALSALYVPSPVREIWRLDVARQATPRTFAVSAASGTTLTLAAADTPQIYTDGMRGHVALRVWNISKTPAESTWVDWNLSANELRVTDAAHIAGWSDGDTLRLGDPDPSGDNVLQMVALNISGYLQSQLGSVFRTRPASTALRVSRAC